jgi:hypothetical protein
MDAVPDPSWRVERREAMSEDRSAGGSWAGGALLILAALLVAGIGGLGSFCAIPPGCADQGGSVGGAIVGFVLTSLSVVGLVAAAAVVFARAYGRSHRD